MRRLALLLFLVALATPAHAHPEGFSGLRLLIWQDKAKAIVSLHTRDLGAWFPTAKHPDYVNDVLREILVTPDDVLELRLDDLVVAPIAKTARLVEPGLIEVELVYPIDKMPAFMTVWSKHLVRLPRGHQQLFFAEDMRAQPELTGGSGLHSETLSRDGDSATFDIPRPRSATRPATMPGGIPGAMPADSPPRASISFFVLGIEHIVTGYDHLLFLAALLLVCKNFKEAAAVITFFTVAHTITLTLAALDIVRLPYTIVEPAIAASIIYVGIENVVGKHRFLWRALVTFGFGLVHGLGFAGVLREVGLGSTSLGVALPLFKFTLGLETGQLVIAFVLLQILLKLKRVPAFDRRWVPACSILISAIGLYWLIERVFGDS